MKCSFWCSHLSRLATLVFPWPRRVYGGSCKIYLFITLPIIKIKGSFVRNVVFFCIHVFCRKSLVFQWRRMSMGEAAKPLLFEYFHASCPIFLRAKRSSF